MDDKERGEVMIASFEGKAIQQKPRGNGERWQDVDSPLWDWTEYRYRVAPDQGYFVIETDRPHRVYRTLESAREEIDEFKRRYPEARIIELVPKI